MITKEKQAELEKHKEIILFTLDYLGQQHGRSFIVDGQSYIQDYYDQQKLQTEKYYQQRRLDRMQQQLRRLTEGLRNRANVYFGSYIKENTGYELDIFAETRNRVELILLQNQINTQEESNDVRLMLSIYEQTKAELEKEEVLKNLLNNFYTQMYPPSGSSQKQKSVRTKVVEMTVKDGIEKEVSISISTGPKAAHFKEKLEISPDGKCRLRVTEWSSDGKRYSTSVSIEFPTASGAIYSVQGLYHQINANWKDNNTIIIEVPKNVIADLYFSIVESFDDRIHIEYVMD